MARRGVRRLLRLADRYTAASELPRQLDAPAQSLDLEALVQKAVAEASFVYGRRDVTVALDLAPVRGFAHAVSTDRGALGRAHARPERRPRAGRRGARGPWRSRAGGADERLDHGLGGEALRGRARRTRILSPTAGCPSG